MTRTKLLVSIVVPLVLGGIPYAVMTQEEAFRVGSNGTKAFFTLGMLLGLPAIASPVVLLLSFVGLFFRKTQWASALVALGSVSYLVAFLISLRRCESIRMKAFHQLAERSQPLVAAIREFELKNGRPPGSLNELVPGFLPGIPGTGMGAYPQYQYLTNPVVYQGNPWVLAIDTPSGGINFDKFLYFPKTNYPHEGYGGRLERVGDWAYVHE
ncbi:MAG: hypothetical protein JNL10_03775 [Verrucomicrobiales bacterium]|nr:hypothetical protein [Verrucomicrobiales bacterium]